jgi:site-specific recombinase XerC
MINRENYLSVKEYLKFKSEVQQRDSLSISRIYSQLKVVLRWLDDCPFADMPNKRPVLPRWVSSLDLVYKPGVKVSGKWVKEVCDTARLFFQWLYLQDSHKYNALSLAWVETLVPGRLLQDPPEERNVVTLDIVRQLIAVKYDPNDTVVRRDRAAAAFLFLSGMRAAAFVSLPIKCVDIAQREVKQYPTLGVRTKNRKAAKTALLNIPDLLEVVQEWDTFIRASSPSDSLWYAPMRWAYSKNILIQNKITVQKAEDVAPHRAETLRQAVKVLFRMANLPYMHPHLFRHGHALYGLKSANTMAEYKAVSMNLMHSNIGTTDGIYAVLSSDDMKELIGHLGQNIDERGSVPSAVVDQLAAVLLQRISDLRGKNMSV